MNLEARHEDSESSTDWVRLTPDILETAHAMIRSDPMRLSKCFLLMTGEAVPFFSDDLVVELRVPRE
jgi:hypothetical protein